VAKNNYNQVDSSVTFPQREEEVLTFWKENKIFEKSVEKNPVDKNWNFLDGPPFVTGMPHYGSLLSSISKDPYGRYYTMKGYRVRRVWGWDGHGLPIENKVENKLNLERKKDIEEKVGVAKFIEECKKYVNEVSGEWEWYVDHIGRWVDFENAYKTWEKDYMETVMWVFKQLYDKDLIYKGRRVSLYCPHCVTPISNFEVAMDADNYQEVTEASNTYKYKATEDDNTYYLAWSTTPWNKIATPALAVNPKLEYVRIKQGDDSYILAKNTVSMLKDEPYEVLEEFKGEKLIGETFEGHYDFYRTGDGLSSQEKNKKAFVIIPGDFVTEEEGTGIVTIAAYGEDDMRAMSEQDIQVVLHVNEEGHLHDDVPNWGGMYYLDVNPLVNKDLADRGLMYEEKQHTHTVPTCWRCHTRLFYSPQDAWFVNVQRLKPELEKHNEEVNWYPEHFKHGRFLNSLKAQPDWCISRSRYWGSPIPVWETQSGKRIVPGSIKELEELSGQKIDDLHKPGIDEVVIKDPETGEEAHRVTEVLDSWIEAGSAAFAERHYPFNENEKLEQFFPPDFIAEYTGQIRAWFNVLHIIAVGLSLSERPSDNIVAKNVLVNGVMKGTDGKKMSKNLGNYPDPREMLTKYGGDALRLYLLSSPIMTGEDMNISEEEYRNQVKLFLLPLQNTYRFFVTYANLDGWSKDAYVEERKAVIDTWIISRLNNLIKEVTKYMDEYNSVKAIEALKYFLVNDFSGWYIRRIRDRVGVTVDDGNDKDSAYTTMYDCLVQFSRLLAPIAPFYSEEIYKNLTKDESVHLSNWPTATDSLIDENLENEMDIARKVVEQAHSARKEAGIKVRQPLNLLEVVSPIDFCKDVIQLIKDETNILIVDVKRGKEISVDLDTTIDDRLRMMGDARDVTREIQSERKRLGTSLDEQVDVVITQEFTQALQDQITNAALVRNLTVGNTFEVKRIEN